ncbi:hypothetical protein [Erythrobacter sp.]|uniref:hypothetical protein n=1 Tax=Erythrobacter sp. TaxID=1042 RepID=UPI0025EAC8F8|nr:hypothetical protein [Erythrobacter sp.]
MTVLIDRAEKHDPHAVRIYRMPPAVRAAHDLWRVECEAMIAAHVATGGPGAAYQAFLEGELMTPAPPRAVADALAMHGAPVLTADMSAADVAAIYQQMLDG